MEKKPIKKNEITLNPVIIPMMIKLYQETMPIEEVYIVGIKEDSPDLKNVLNFTKEQICREMQLSLRDDLRYTFVIGNKKC
ncbi:MAG TPA: hypothetical protein VMY59_08325 [Candidatus Thermoplasmatota archaeon]|nr:hypothetical protein [Candidatus Thermoplasmatota archaeon]